MARKANTRCRHERHSWMLCGVHAWEWCYLCGAIRRLQYMPGTTNTLAPDTGWLMPTGHGGKNPLGFPALTRRNSASMGRTHESSETMQGHSMGAVVRSRGAAGPSRVLLARRGATSPRTAASRRRKART